MSTASVALSPIQNPFDIPSECLPSHLGQNGKEPILIFLAVSGSVIPLHVSESESVASVKLRIQRHKGFFVTNHKLVFDGRELARNDSPVLDYGVTDGTLLHLAIRLSDLQAITVRSVCGKEYEFHIDRSRNVGYLKKQIAESGNGIFNVKDQALVCDGEELEDQRLIQEYCRNSSDDSVIHLLVRKSAKVRTKPVGKEFELSVEAVVTSTVDENATAKKSEIKLTVDPVIDRRVGVVEKKKIEEFFLKPLIANPRIENPLVIRKLVESTYSGLFSGKQPIRSSEASGGVYFMQDSSGQEFVSIFKPVDEEPMAVNNPKGLPCSNDGEGLKKGTTVGEGALREVAAFILDHPMNGPRRLLLSGKEEEEGYAGVPPTTMVKCLHKGFYHPRGYQSSLKKNVKIGSLQMYVKNIGSCEEMGPSAFPVEEVHKICVLDIRLANTDRHSGNILVSRDDQGGKIKLVPIDHGYCLPKQFEDCTFDWLYWPQARRPFSAETVDYIKSLDAEQDIKLLKLHGWDVPPECKLILQISTMLLKKGVNRGLTPFTIGCIMCRVTLKKESLIEQIVDEARREASTCSTDESAFLEVVSTIMDQKLDQLS